MRGMARLFDLAFGIDYSKGTPVQTLGLIIGPGVPKLKANGRTVAASFDMVRALTGGIGMIMTRQKRIFAMGRPIAGIFDLVIGPYQGIILQGSHNVILRDIPDVALGINFIGQNAPTPTKPVGVPSSSQLPAGSFTPPPQIL